MSRLWSFDEKLLEGGPGVGVDEAGRGPLAGPVVACAVLAPASRPRVFPLLRDGKTLSHGQRLEVFLHARRSGVRYALAFSGHEEIDRVNILRASLDAMARAVERLAPPERYTLLVDGPHPVPGLRPLRQVALIDGDARSWCVALAGVIAKVSRDRWMGFLDRKYPGYRFAANKGYPTPDHQKALVRLGPCAVHRRSYAPVKEVL